MANTEPVLRLVVESENLEDLHRRVEELKKLIYREGGTDHNQ
jgi:phosphomannomutase